MAGKKLGKMIISVKSDKKLTISYVRDLIGTLSNDNTAEMAGLLCIDEPTDGMRQECLKAGFYEIDYGLGIQGLGMQKFPKVQMLTVKDIIEGGKTFQTPFKVQKKIAEHSNKPDNVLRGVAN